MPGISIHVVDVSRGRVASGMKVAVFRVAAGARTQIAAGILSAAGTLDDVRLAAGFAPGQYEADFHVGAYYAAAGVPLPAVPFLDIVTYRFGIADSAQHYHLPFKCTPWGYSCFRGGA
jgi:5-hydroxyisourate hydrolase